MLIKSLKNKIEYFERNYKLLYFLSFILLVFICLPRFNQNNFWIVKNIVGNNGHLGEYSIDTQNYIDIIEYIRGDDSKIDSISVPYIYRVLPLYLASLIPAPSLTSLNILNLISLIIALWIQIKTLEKLSINKGVIIILNLLFVLNFPTFYFGTSGVVDPFIIMMFYLSIYLIVNKKDILFILIIFLAALSKETAIILIPFYLFNRGFNKNSLIISILAFIIFLIGTYLSRTIIELNSNYIWKMDYDNLLFNLGRIRSYFSYVVSYLYFLPILFYFIRKRYFKTKIERSLIVGIILGNMVFVYSFLAAYPDSRLIWIAYPFTLIYFGISLNKSLINSTYNVGQ